MESFLQENSITVGAPKAPIHSTVALASSKSESNRSLIIQALANGSITLANLAEARDTQTMIRLLKSEEKTLDVLDAGTTMRFLTAYCTAMARPTILTGTERMQQRPIGILVDALREMGAEIDYLNQEGYPPIEIKQFEQKNAAISIRGDVSSQYISALLMIAPTLPHGLELTLTGHLGSIPYIQMTLTLMERFGVTHTWEGNQISVAPQEYQAGNYQIESDWSGASYWFSVVALSPQPTSLFLKGLREDSLQGDKAIVEIMEQLGVQAVFQPEGVQLTQIPAKESLAYDFTNCPDLAQTVSVVCAAKQLPAKLTGLESLRIKETDRIAAIQQEIHKLGGSVEVFGDDAIEIKAVPLQLEGKSVHTYEDHRMAMAFAPLALLGTIQIETPNVVAKSYPSFWKHLQEVGFKITNS